MQEEYRHQMFISENGVPFPLWFTRALRVLGVVEDRKQSDEDLSAEKESA